MTSSTNIFTRGDYVISTDALEHIPPGMVNFSTTQPRASCSATSTSP